MTSSVVNISSESENSDDGNKSSKCSIKKEITNSHNPQTISISQNVKDDNLHEQEFVENQSSTENIPLFKIIFRDELVSRKYRRRIQDIINYIVTTQFDENESMNISSPDLLLEIYDPIDKIQFPKTSLTPVTVVDALPNNSNQRKRKLQCDIQCKKHDKKLKHKHQPQDKMSIQNIKNTKSHSSNKNGNLKTRTKNNSLKCEKNVEPISIKNEDTFYKTDYLEICLFMESAQIGSYNYIINNYSSIVKTISLSEDGVTFFVPTFKYEKQLKVISVELDDIVKALVHFSKTKSALVFCVTNVAAKGIRESLSMDDPYGPYLDPESKKLIHQRIVILPAAIHHNAERMIRELFKNKEIIEIDRKAVDDLLNAENSIRNEINPSQTNNDSDKNKNQLKTTANVFSSDLNINDDIRNEINPSQTNNNNDKNQLKTTVDVFSSDLNINNDMETILFCHVIKVGSYEYAKKRVFSISKKNVKFCIPLINESTTITLSIKMDEIEKIEINSSDVLKVLFLYISSSAAKVIRKTLRMKKSKTPYFNPKMQDGIHDKIIIFPQAIPDDCPVINKLYKQGKIQKLDEETANNILSKSFQNTENEPKSNTDTESISLETKSLTIACYKCDFMQLNVIISTYGLGLHIPDIRGSSIDFKYIQVHIRDIQKASFHMSENLNVLFFYISKGCANKIRHLYDLKNSLQLNYSLMGTGTAKKIVIEFRKISNQNEILLKNLLTSVVKAEEIIPIDLAQQML